MPGDLERCIAAGANHYLAKPVKLKQLLELIADYLAPTDPESDPD
jgi:CheY-like chemotaxis protein